MNWKSWGWTRVSECLEWKVDKIRTSELRGNRFVIQNIYAGSTRLAPTALVVVVEQSVWCVCVRTIISELNDLDLYTWHVDSSWSFRISKVKVRGLRINVSFSAINARYDVTYAFRNDRGQRQTCWQHLHNLLVVCRVLCAKVVGATSSEGFLVVCSVGEVFKSKCVISTFVLDFLYPLSLWTTWITERIVMRSTMNLAKFNSLTVIYGSL